jgi:acetyltransferase-like isoleucine patch superfamily enzyme
MDMENRFKDWKYPKINNGKPTKWNWIVDHVENLKLGFKTDIGTFTYINAKKGVVIEDRVQVGSHCSIYSYSTIDRKEGTVILKKNCKVGSHSIVMPNVTIGENSIIGAFSLVNHDVPPNVVAFGIPVKVIRGIGE